MLHNVKGTVLRTHVMRNRLDFSLSRLIDKKFKRLHQYHLAVVIMAEDGLYDQQQHNYGVCV